MAGLTDTAIKKAKPGRYGDGRGLSLWVKDGGARSWMLRIQVGGRRRDIGLGAYPDMSLSDARELSAQLRKVAKAGGDPIAERDKDKRSPPSFAEAAREAHDELSKGWRPKHAAAFMASLETHANPVLGKLLVAHVTVSNVRDALAPIWLDKPVMARKVRVRIGQVLDYAMAKGWRSDGAPAAKTVKLGLSKQPKGKHFPAMPYTDVPAFYSALCAQGDTMGRLALRFLILTAARSVEVRKARWSQFDLDARLWTRPADVMGKTGEAHTVTLSREAMAVLEALKPLWNGKTDALVFQGAGGKMLSDMTISKVMRDAGLPYVPHGFRSSFRDFCAEKMPTVPAAAAEVCIAHTVGDETTRAYLRTEFVELRFKLLNAWGAHCLGHISNVVTLAGVA